MLEKGPRVYSNAPTKEEKERCIKARDKIKFINVKFQNRQVVWLRERGRR